MVGGERRGWDKTTGILHSRGARLIEHDAGDTHCIRSANDKTSALRSTPDKISTAHESCCKAKYFTTTTSMHWRDYGVLSWPSRTPNWNSSRRSGFVTVRRNEQRPPSLVLVSILFQLHLQHVWVMGSLSSRGVARAQSFSSRSTADYRNIVACKSA